MGNSSTPSSATPHQALIGPLWLGTCLLAACLTTSPLVYVIGSLGYFAAWIVYARDAWTPQRVFGAANIATSARIVTTAFLPAIHAAIPTSLFILLVIAILVMDGLDGWLARRLNIESAFGAGLDVEADAFLVTVMCLILWTTGLTNVWVLLGGAWRYLYVTFAAIAPNRVPEPRSRLARWIYVSYLVSLCAAFLFPAWATPLAGSATALLSLSFLRSFAWSFGLRTSTQS